MAIAFVGAHEGCIELYDDKDEFVAAYRTPEMLADAIIKAGGCAPVVYGSSSFHHATEHGWDSQEEMDWVWKRALEWV